MTKTAILSACRRYRYVLTRTWGNTGRGSVLFIMLNPSTADEAANDPTVERCERRARAWGYDGLVVVNIFAWRSTDPSILGTMSGLEAIGPDNPAHILEQATNARQIICAWGQHGRLWHQGDAVRELLREFTLYALKVSTSTGQPHHPLYLKYTLTPFVWLRRTEA